MKLPAYKTGLAGALPVKIDTFLHQSEISPGPVRAKADIPLTGDSLSGHKELEHSSGRSIAAGAFSSILGHDIPLLPRNLSSLQQS